MMNLIGWSISQSVKSYITNPLTPFEVYFGRYPNTLKSKLFLGEKKEFEVQEQNFDFNLNVYEIAKQGELRELADERFVIRQEALEASKNAAKKMVKRELKRQPPWLYSILLYKGETILVGIATARKTQSMVRKVLWNPVVKDGS